MNDATLKAILNRGGIGETLYEGEVGEMNMPTWYKLAEAFRDYYDLQNYTEYKELDNDNNA
jgi:hypothetical protein